jgi:mannose-6-phosphate isomerase-like protein (cupin superfamily)
MSYPPPIYTAAEPQTAARLRPGGQPPDLVLRSGSEVRYLASTDTTGGLFGLYHWTMVTAGGGRSAHFHRTMAESFYILSGKVGLYDGEQWVTAGAGDYFYVPPGSIHDFRNDFDSPASMLVLFTPGAPREPYFENLHRLTEMTPEQRDGFLRSHDNLLVSS